MRKFIILSCFNIWILIVHASEAPDNFFLSLDKDLHTFGVLKNRRWWNRSKDEGTTAVNKAKSALVSKKSESVKGNRMESKTELKESNNGVVDEFEMATKKIFDAIENAEKVALTATKALIHKEVDTFFGKHDRELPSESADKQVLERSRRKVAPKKDTKQKEEEPKQSRFGRFINEYFDSCCE